MLLHYNLFTCCSVLYLDLCIYLFRCVCACIFFLFFSFLLQIFDRLRKESPDVIKNVRAIEANFEAHDLNISQENKNIIWDEVDVRDVVCFVEYQTSFVHCSFFFPICVCVSVPIRFRYSAGLSSFLTHFFFPFLPSRSFRCRSFAQIVFNVVASVKFNEKLRDAVEINVLGTKKILDLVMGIKNLKVCMQTFKMSYM